MLSRVTYASGVGGKKSCGGGRKLRVDESVVPIVLCKDSVLYSYSTR